MPKQQLVVSQSATHYISILQAVAVVAIFFSLTYLPGRVTMLLHFSPFHYHTPEHTRVAFFPSNTRAALPIQTTCDNTTLLLSSHCFLFALLLLFYRFRTELFTYC